MVETLPQGEWAAEFIRILQEADDSVEYESALAMALNVWPSAFLLRPSDIAMKYASGQRDARRRPRQ